MANENEKVYVVTLELENEHHTSIYKHEKDARTFAEEVGTVLGFKATITTHNLM